MSSTLSTRIAGWVQVSSIGLFLLLSCKDNTKTYKVAVIVDQSGATAEIGRSVLDGIKFASEIFGDNILVVDFDDENDENTARTRALEVVSDPACIAVIGHSSSGISSVAQDVYGRFGMPFIMPVATKPSITITASENGFNNVLRVVPSHDLQATKIIDFTVKSLHCNRPMVVNDQSEYGIDLGLTLERAFKSINVDVPIRKTVDWVKPNGVDYSSVVENMQRYRIDVLIFAGYYNEAVFIVKQIREASLHIPIVLTDGCFQDKLLDNVSANSDSVFVAFVAPDWKAVPRAKSLLDWFSRAHGGSDPTYAPFAADAFGMICQAASQNENCLTRGMILQTLKHPDFVYSGITGLYRFNSNGDWIGGSNYIYRLNKAKNTWDYIN